MSRDESQLIRRKSVRDLSQEEKNNFVEAVWGLKESGKYDEYVKIHAQAAMTPAITVSEMENLQEAGFDPGSMRFRDEAANIRNVPHKGPAFLPWHREFLRRFEQDLQAEVPEVSLPYWNWTQDRALSDPTAQPPSFDWSEDLKDLVGGNGDPNADPDLPGLVISGPFAFDPSGSSDRSWKVVDHQGDERNRGLIRQFGQTPRPPAFLPAPNAVYGNTGVINITPYDQVSWDQQTYPSFRNVLEGWRDVDGSARTSLHNYVHIWVGGDMLAHTSPNDPVFFLHHCFIDKIWADWQKQMWDDSYLPENNQNNAPQGHRFEDNMDPWETTPRDVFDILDLGYIYD